MDDTYYNELRDAAHESFEAAELERYRTQSFASAVLTVNMLATLTEGEAAQLKGALLAIRERTAAAMAAQRARNEAYRLREIAA